MNRTFTVIALQSAAAAAILVAAPLVSAESWTEPQVAASTSTVSRAEVRQAAIEALHARQHIAYNGETAGDLTAAPFVSTLSRAQVHAEAVEAARLGVTSNYDGNRVITPAQLTQIRDAGLRATQAQDRVAAAKQ